MSEQERTPLRVLVAEDSTAHADLLLRELQDGGFDVTFERVESTRALEEALVQGPWDVVLSDYRTGDFQAQDALTVVRRRDPDIPFIVVSDTAGEDTAVEVMRAGAHDYLVKGSLRRLMPAVRRELGQAEVRRERRRTRAELQEAEDRFRTLVERVQAIVYVAPVGDGPWEYVSPQVSSVLGFSAEEWMADPGLWHRCLHPEDRDRVQEEVRRAVERGRVSTLEYRMFARDGRIVWLQDSAEVIPAEEGSPVRLRGLMVDITARKRTEEELRASLDLLQRTDEERRRLLRQLIAAQEDERGRIAGDIHDDSIQVMTAVGMRLEMLERKLAEPEDVQVLKQLEEVVRLAVGRLRHLLFELRPPALDRDGLVPALRQYLSETLEPAGVGCEVHNLLDEEPPTITRYIVYRIAQEALTNVRKHALAQRVILRLESVDGGVLVRLADDGVGFEPEGWSLDGPRTKVAPGHLGLVSMRERAETAGGRMSIRSEPGAGTWVEFWIPLQGDAADPRSGSRRRSA